jgi:hypothetical protein
LILNLIKVSTTASERLRSSAQTGIDSGAFALQEPSAEMKASFSFGEPQRVARRERILCLKQFVIAADMPDDHTARSHRRERKAYAELTDSEDDLD